MNNKYFRSEGALKSSSNIVPNSKRLDKLDPLDSLDLYNKSPARNPRSTSLDRLNNLTSAYNQVMNKELGSTVGSTGRLSK